MEQKLGTLVWFETWDMLWTVSLRMMPILITSAVPPSCTYKTLSRYDI